MKMVSYPHGFILSGKAWEIRSKLQQWLSEEHQSHITLQAFMVKKHLS